MILALFLAGILLSCTQTEIIELECDPIVHTDTVYIYPYYDNICQIVDLTIDNRGGGAACFDLHPDSLRDQFTVEWQFISLYTGTTFYVGNEWDHCVEFDTRPNEGWRIYVSLSSATCFRGFAEAVTPLTD